MFTCIDVKFMFDSVVYVLVCPAPQIFSKYVALRVVFLLFLLCV